MNRLLALCLLLPAVPSLAQPASSGLAGSWAGLLSIPNEPSAFAVVLRQDGDRWSGTLDFPARDVTGAPFDSVAVAGDSVYLRLFGGYAELAGRLDAARERVEGTARIGQGRAPFALARPGSPEAQAFADEIAAAPAYAPHADPDSARLVTEDLPRFWAAYDASTPEDRADAFQRGYLDPGTPGLKDFVFLRIGSAEDLASAVNAHADYYESARASMDRIPAFEPQIRAAFRRLEDLYPEAVYPDVYFLVGLLSTGGTTSARGLLIGSEMYGRTPETPMEGLPAWLQVVLSPVDNVPAIVAHELVHYEQDYPRDTTLLGQALREGIADYVGELIAGAHINRAQHAYGDQHEGELWCAFQAQMRGGDFSDWLYNGARSADRPGDLGYYEGYKIAEAYAARARADGADEAAVVRDLLTIPDFAAFLRASGYAERFPCPSGG